MNLQTDIIMLKNIHDKKFFKIKERPTTLSPCGERERAGKWGESLLIHETRTLQRKNGDGEERTRRKRGRGKMQMKEREKGEDREREAERNKTRYPKRSKSSKGVTQIPIQIIPSSLRFSTPHSLIHLNLPSLSSSISCSLSAMLPFGSPSAP